MFPLIITNIFTIIIYLVPWQPCLVRNFDESVAIPNMVDVALALTATNLEDLGSNLFRILSYVRAYIGNFDNSTIKFCIKFLHKLIKYHFMILQDI